MEAEQSIVLQKKMILFLSLMIIATFGIIYSREKNNNIPNSYVETVNEIDLVTVKVPEDENEILRENVKYLATKVINTESILNLAEINNDQVEIFAGDVTNLVDTSLENLNKNEENVVVATNNESTEELVTSNDESENTIIENNKEIVLKDEIIEENDVAENIEVIVEQVEIETNQTEVEKPKTVRYKDLAEDNPPTEYLNVVEVSATAYCLCKKCCGKTPDNPYYGYTHSGIKIEPGTGMKVIAVDPNIIPLKSKVYVEGLNGAWDYGYAIAADTGSAIKQLKIDLYMDTHEEALQWGRKKVKVYVLGE